MSGGAADTRDEAAEAAPKKKSKLPLIVAAIVVLLGIVAGLWFSGILPKLLGMDARKQTAAAPPGHALAASAEAAPVYLDVPEIITNLNVPGRRPSYLKLHAKLQLGAAADTAPATIAMPRILDMFQTYLRDMRPEELRGSEGSYRLREELIARAAVAIAPATVRDVLFEEMIIQ